MASVTWLIIAAWVVAVYVIAATIANEWRDK